MNIYKILDLTLPLTNEVPIYPGDPIPSIKPATTIEKEGYNTHFVHIGSHTGTHVDAPYHFRKDGDTMDKSPLAYFAGEGVLISVTGKQEAEAITLPDVEPFLEQLAPGKIALFHTGWSTYVGEEKYYNHPYIHISVIEEMLKRGIRTFFIDALNVDPPDGSFFPVHEAITAVNGIIGENFTNFDQIDFVHPFIVAFPLNIKGSDGSPVRAVALKLR